MTAADCKAKRRKMRLKNGKAKLPRSIAAAERVAVALKNKKKK